MLNGCRCSDVSQHEAQQHVCYESKRLSVEQRYRSVHRFYKTRTVHRQVRLYGLKLSVEKS